ncbi:hypothetical protein JW926_14875 [Candidatus Sumerlaeota bacterium]|nr:hypothetical protein [Candidatus Sumerlaeota bacterium]
MSIYYYFSVLPEALIASMLSPEDFCSYFAIGSEKRASGQAILFEAAPDFSGDYFDLSDMEKRCAPHPGGEPKHSLYLSIYRVLEHLPLSALKNLHLVTPDARILKLPKSDAIPAFTQKIRLYQELCPVQPRIASSLDPVSFCRFMTDSSHAIHVPKLFFAELRLGDLAEKPETGSARDLPYPALMHLRDCLKTIKNNPEKHTKTVDRIPPAKFPYRMVESGFYIGDQKEICYYPFPPEKELEEKYHVWWRSATL